MDTGDTFPVLNRLYLHSSDPRLTTFSFVSSLICSEVDLHAAEQGNGREIAESLHREQGNVVRKKTIRAHREAEIAAGLRYISQNPIPWSCVLSWGALLGKKKGTDDNFVGKSWDWHRNSPTGRRHTKKRRFLERPRRAD